jgi:hypothetical protein
MKQIAYCDCVAEIDPMNRDVARDRRDVSALDRRIVKIVEVIEN